MLRQRFLALLTVLLALCATPRLACACSTAPVCSDAEAGAHIMAIASGAVDCCGGETSCSDEDNASQQTSQILTQTAPPFTQTALSLTQTYRNLPQTGPNSTRAAPPLALTNSHLASSTKASIQVGENRKGNHSTLQNEHGACHMTSSSLPAVIHESGLSLEKFCIRPAVQAITPFFLQKKCTALIGIFNKAPPYFNGFGGSETYLFKRVLLI